MNYRESLLSRPSVPRSVRHLARLKIPIRCHDTQESIGLTRWLEASPRITSLWHAWEETVRRRDHAADDRLEALTEASSAGSIELIASICDRVREIKDFREDQYPLASWLVCFIVWRELEKMGSSVSEVCPPDRVGVQGRRVRGILEFVRELPIFRSDAMQEVIALLLSWPDTTLGSFYRAYDPDYVGEFLGLGPNQGRDVTLTAEHRAKAFKLEREHSERAERAGLEFKRLKALAVSAQAELITAIDRAAAHLPPTGEIAELLGLIQTSATLVRVISEGDQAEFVPLAKNRVLARFALGLAMEGIEWDQGARAALAALIRAPKVFTRYTPTTDSGRLVKARLKCLRKCLTGYCPTVEQTCLLELLGRDDITGDDILCVLAEYLLQRETGSEWSPEFQVLYQEMGKALSYMLADNPFHSLGLSFHVRPYLGGRILRTAVDLEIERLAADEEAQAQANARAQSEASKPQIFTPYVEPVSAPESSVNKGGTPDAECFDLCYVLNPASDTPRLFQAKCRKEDCFSMIKNLVDEHTDLLALSSSLARAVCHHAFEVPEEIRQTWNKESVGRFVFHKIKRGRARLYVRVEGKTITFSAYSRRDWVKPMVCGGRLMAAGKRTLACA